MTLLVTDIDWDLEGAGPAECGLPTAILVLAAPADWGTDAYREQLSLEVSNAYGFGHYGFKVEAVVVVGDGGKPAVTPLRGFDSVMVAPARRRPGPDEAPVDEAFLVTCGAASLPTDEPRYRYLTCRAELPGGPEYSVLCVEIVLDGHVAVRVRNRYGTETYVLEAHELSRRRFRALCLGLGFSPADPEDTDGTDG